MNEPTCHVLTLPSRPHLLEQFMRRWNRATGRRPITPFYAVPDADPVASCYASHQTLLQRAQGPVAVFEEDAVFSAAFTLDVQPPDLAEGPPALVLLGGQQITPPVRIAPGWVRPTRWNRTHGYIATDPHRLAEGLEAHTHPHVDDALSAMDVPVVALELFTVGQAAGVSAINGRLYRAHRFWND